MTRVQRRLIQAGALGIIALACISEVKFQSLPGRIAPELSRGWYAVLDVVPGSSFVLAGLVAWSLRPRNRVGLLMIGVGGGLLTRNAALQQTVGQVSFPLEVGLHFI